MGLDMYLNGRRFISEFDKGIEEVRKAVIKAVDGLNPPKNSKVNTVQVEVAYWRKANAIHNWFVDNVQDGVDECQESYVSRQKLEQLRNDCKTVLSDWQNTELIMELLPPRGGFFFGSTEVDEWYIRDVEYTFNMLNEILSPEYSEWDFYYQASW